MSDLDYKAETIQKCKDIYEKRKETIEYMIKFGNILEQAEALLIKQVATNAT